MARLPYVIPYDPDFLGGGFRVPLPGHQCIDRLYLNGQAIDYIHFSLILHKNRKSALVTAHNIDASQLKSVDRTGWDTDPRVNDQYQTDNAAYVNNPWDKGHLVRRAAVAWGTNQRAKDASDSTFFYTVAVMQHSTFNQSDSKWLGLENWVLEKAGQINDRLCVLTGPIYTKIDQTHRGFRIPSAFFKVVVLRDPTANGDDLSALGFVMTQNEGWRMWRNRRIENLEPYLVGIQDIELYTGLNFGEIAFLDEFNWRQPQFRNRTLMKPIKINGSEDIKFMGDRRRARGGIRATKYQEVNALGSPVVPESDEKCKDCSKKNLYKDKQLIALKNNVEALTSVVESMLENNDANFKVDRLNLLRSKLQRVVGGVIVDFEEFNECAAIGNETSWFCTGVLIDKNIVLTAAHCAPDISRVFLGGRQISDIRPHQIINVKSVHIHPHYRPNQIPSHDIAVLILDNDAPYDPVEVADKEAVDKEDNMLLVGFGSDDPNGVTGYGTKRKADATRTVTAGLPSNEIDRLQYTHGFDHQYEFHTGKRGLGIDTCYGDSGGPAYIVDGNKRKLAGITSRAAFSADLDCGDGGNYTRVDPYLNWIKSLIDGNPVDDDRVTGQNIYISAALPNPSGPDPGNEWIEIKNIGNEAIEISNYTLADKQGGEINLSGRLDANSSLRTVIPKKSPLKLANAGEDILLKHNDVILHKVSYGSAGSGQIIIFDPPHHNDDNQDNDMNQADPC